MEKSQKVLILSSIILVGFTIAVIYHYVLGFYYKLGDTYNSFCWSWLNPFDDFASIINLIKTLTPFEKTNIYVNYFPLTYILLYPFCLFTNKLFAYLIFLFPFLAYFLTLNKKNFYCENLLPLQNFRNIFILSFISYPFLILLDRGNFDIFLFLILGLFIYAFNNKKYFLAAVLIALENACKPFFAIFLVLFLFKKKFKEFFFSLIISFLLIIGGFLVLKGDFYSQISTLIINLAQFKLSYVYANNDLGTFASSSLYMCLKIILTRILMFSANSIYFLVKSYNILYLLFTGIILFFTYKEKIFWKQITLLSLQALLLPYLVNDYKLIFLFIPVWFFVNEKNSKFDLIYTILFGLLLIPKNIIIPTPYLFPDSNFSLSVILNPLIMLIFIMLIIFEQFYNKKKLILERGLNE